MFIKSATTLGALGLFVLLVNCTGDSLPCEDTKTCVSAGPGGDAGSDVVIPDGCDLTKAPADSPACVANGVGIFVDSTNGSDASGDGTREHPLKTIAGGVARAGSHPRLYVCSGSYPEHVSLKQSLSLFGGLDCKSWTPMSQKSEINPVDEGTALEVLNSQSQITISGFRVAAANASKSGGSSIAAFFANVSDARIVDCSFAAGNGQNGASASPTPADPTAAAPPGNAGGDPMNPGTAKPNPSCPKSIGGAGGNDVNPAGADGSEKKGATFYPDDAPGLGGMATSCVGGGLGRNGSYGEHGTGGAALAAAGSIDATGWHGSDGAAGTNGTDGQGGGGGGRVTPGGFGGSGGPGGCGGVGGGGGFAGGSSLGLVLFKSKVSIARSEVSTGSAGSGTAGAKGQKGQVASSTQAGPDGSKACAGGFGGIGGSGGGGSGGGGGMSVGVVRNGGELTIENAPVENADTVAGISVGSAGAPGTNGAGADAASTSPQADVTRLKGEDGKAGAAGASKAVLSF